jgi:probable HAF family extracellular repeat protein
VVGLADSSANGYEAFRWTSGGGMVGLGDLPGGIVTPESEAIGVSDDGLVIVGQGNQTVAPEAFRWTSGGGMVGLGDLSGGAFESNANNVSGDGSVIVGFGTSASGLEAFRWTSGGGMVGLGDFAGGSFTSSANDLSADGSVIVGTGNSALGAEAFIWDAANGMQSVIDLLDAQGVNLSGWRLTHARGISADGTVIVGIGLNPAGDQEAWLATISPVPVPGAIWLFGSGLLGLVGMARRKKAA